MATISWDVTTGSRMVDLSITKMKSGDRDLRLYYRDGQGGGYGITDHYTVYWWYKENGVWRQGPTNENDDFHGEDYLYGYDYYTAPDTATEVRARVQAFAKTYKDSEGNEHYYYEENPSSYTYYKFNENKPGLDTKYVTDVSLRIQSGTTSSLYATWTWGFASQTDHFEIEWAYSTVSSGGTWFDPTLSDIGPTVRQASYNIPNNARRVRLRIRAVSKKHIETYTGGQYNTRYWYGGWSTYYFVYGGTVTPTTKRSVTPVRLAIQTGTDSSLYALWSWNYVSQTDHFETEWKYSTVASGGTWFGDASPKNEPANTTQSNYTVPSNAKRVRFRIRPVALATAETYNNPENTFGVRTSAYYAGEWTTFYWTNGGYKAPSNKKSVSPVTLSLQSGTDSTILAKWDWNFQSETEKFKIEWKFDSGDGVWFDGSTSEIQPSLRQATYNMPSQAKRVRFRILPVSKRYKTSSSSGDTYGTYETSYWAGEWSTPYYYSVGGYVAPSSKNKVNYISVDLVNGTDRDLFATWEWKDTKQTDHFDVVWQYDTGNNVWFDGSKNELEASARISTYNPPSNAIRVRVKILPTSKEYTKKTSSGTTTGTYTTSYWVGQWSSWVIYKFIEAKTPATPSVPNVTIDQYTLTAELDSYDVNTQYIEFEVVKNDKKTVNSGQSKVVTNHAAFSCKVDVGGQYKVRARGLLPVSKTPKVTNQVKTTVGNCEAGEWSEYSSNVTTVPKAPAKIKSHKVENETSVWLYWDTVSSATGYTIEYAKDKMFFDSSTEAQSQSINTNSGQMFISGLDTGTTWFFRLQATNEQGASGWTPVYSIILGVKPAPPTTWSETSTVIVGEDAVLYWMHNSEDGSSQREADIKVKVNGTEVHVTPTKMSTDGTASYAVVPTRTTTSGNLADRNGTEIYVRNLVDNGVLTRLLCITSVDDFAAGSVIQWQVRTRGVLEAEDDGWSGWSVVRTIVVYEQPVVELTVSDRSDLSTYIYTLNKYPFYVNGVAYPDTQDVVGWNCSIIANNAYESRNQNGTTRYIKEGEEIFSKYYSNTSKNLTIEFRPEDVDLENNITYTVVMSVVMNSGLSGESSKSFTVDWEYTDLEPNAEVSIDPELLTAYILPYCRDANGDPIPNILLSVYRREYDGRFVEIASGIDNSRSITVTDPHPALDYARYRIVAQSMDTGLVDYYDLPGVPVGETGIIIQWDEDWSNYNYANGNAFDPLSEPVHTGSMLRLPYNINVSDNYGMDVSLVEYIGRSHPVSYYGTQLGVTSNWTSDIPRDDAETLYALRRLAIYQGDAYVREPSGSGYWAQVVPSFNKSYDSITIPVTLDITRVEGGV